MLLKGIVTEKRFAFFERAESWQDAKMCIRDRGRAVSLFACGVWAVYAGAALFFRHKRKKEKQQWQNILRQ